MHQNQIIEIKENLLYILDKIVCSRQYLNKHFQNSMNNYFLENYATLPSLKKRFQTQSGRQVRKDIFEKYSAEAEKHHNPDGQLKCFLIMHGFVQEHILNQSLDEYREALAEIFNTGDASPLKKGSAEWVSLQWKRLFALMVLHHTHYPDIQGVYELWFHIFEDRLIARERQKKKKEEILPKKGRAPYMIGMSADESDKLIKKEEQQSVQEQSSSQSNFPCDFQSKLEDQEEFEEPAIRKKRRTEDTIILLQDQRSNPASELGSPLASQTNSGTLIKTEYCNEEQRNASYFHLQSEYLFTNEVAEQQFNYAYESAVPLTRNNISIPFLTQQQQSYKMEDNTSVLDNNIQYFQSTTLWDEKLVNQGRFECIEDQMHYFHQEQPKEEYISTTAYHDQSPAEQEDLNEPVLSQNTSNYYSYPTENYGDQLGFDSYQAYPDHSQYYNQYQSLQELKCNNINYRFSYPQQEQQLEMPANQEAFYFNYSELKGSSDTQQYQQQQTNHTWKPSFSYNNFHKQIVVDASDDVCSLFQQD